MTATLERTSLTVEQLARRTGWGRQLLEEVIADCELLGLVERDAGGWRLTDEAERLYGAAFRSFEGPV